MNDNSMIHAPWVERRIGHIAWSTETLLEVLVPLLMTTPAVEGSVYEILRKSVQSAWDDGWRTTLGSTHLWSSLMIAIGWGFFTLWPGDRHDVVGALMFAYLAEEDTRALATVSPFCRGMSILFLLADHFLFGVWSAVVLACRGLVRWRAVSLLYPPVDCAIDQMVDLDSVQYALLPIIVRRADYALGNCNVVGPYFWAYVKYLAKNEHVRRLRRAMCLSQLEEVVPLDVLGELFAFLYDVQQARSVPSVCKAFQGLSIRFFFHMFFFVSRWLEDGLSSRTSRGGGCVASSTLADETRLSATTLL